MVEFPGLLRQKLGGKGMFSVPFHAALASHLLAGEAKIGVVFSKV